MPTPGHGHDAVLLATRVNARFAPDARNVRVDVRPLSGGLVSRSVIHATVRYIKPTGRDGARSFVVKLLEGVAKREASVYERLLSGRMCGIGPELYEVHRQPSGHVQLCLEAVVPLSQWPWKDLAFAGEVLARASRLHRMPPIEQQLEPWNYDGELAVAATKTLEAAEAFARYAPYVRRSLPALRRLRRNISSIRRELLAFKSVPKCIVHGDLHPGNVVVRKRRGRAEPILLDWERARPGSPLEDVASWLQWLGFWEPEARRKHDSLLGVYLASRGLPSMPTSELRSAYWMAGASNCFAGVLPYYFQVASDAALPADRRASALRAIEDCFRVMRRADAYWG